MKLADIGIFLTQIWKRAAQDVNGLPAQNGHALLYVPLG